ncbi:MAG TPA: hypothetical protein VFB50_12355 [Chloroflexota bacterium]|nr:hypothetical protein [Chloroflexota bacterium]
MPYVARYEVVDAQDPKSGTTYRVRRRIDKRTPEDILKDVVYAVRRASRVVEGVTQAGLLGETDPAQLFLMAGVRIRQEELRRELPMLIAAAQAAEGALAHTRQDDVPPTRVSANDPPALP